MKTYVEEIEEGADHGIRMFSLVVGGQSYTGEVRASGVDVYNLVQTQIEDEELEYKLTEDLSKYLVNELDEKS